MKILELKCGLFPDGETVQGAVTILERDDHAVSRIDASTLAPDNDDTWDTVVQEILMADQVITV